MTNPALAGSAAPALPTNRVRLNGYRLETVAAAPQTVVRLGVGATGEWAGKAFRILGGASYLGAAGLWREWHLAFADGAEAWLTDQGGDTILREELETPAGLPGFEDHAPGATFELVGEQFTLTCKHEAQRLHVHGSAPSALGPVLRVLGFEGREASLRLEFEETGTRLYLVTRLKLAELNLSDLPAVEPERVLTRVDCPTCGTQLPHVPDALAFGGCSGCGALLELSNSAPRVLRAGPVRRKTASSKAFTLALNESAQMLGSRYTVVGAVRRKSHEFGDPASSSEYWLFSEQAGVLRLREHSDGTWWVSERSPRTPTHNSSDAWLDGAHFRTSHAYVATVDVTVGSVSSLIAEGDAHQAMEFRLEGLGGGLREGSRLVRELSDDELRWRLFHPLDAKIVLNAFSAEAPAVAAARRRPVAVARTSLADLKRPLRWAVWGNAALWLANPNWVTFAVAGGAVACIASLALFSWLFEGERL